METLGLSSTAPARQRPQCSARAVTKDRLPTDSDGWARKRIQELQRELGEKDRQLRERTAESRLQEERLALLQKERLEDARRATSRLRAEDWGQVSATVNGESPQEASRAEEERRIMDEVGRLNALSYLAFFVMVVFDLWLAGKSLPQ